MTKEEKTRIIIKSMHNFNYFVQNIFSKSFEKFKSGDYIIGIAEWMQANPWFMRVSARDHFKSTSLYADFMWHLLKNFSSNKEYHYFSYQDSMAGYHIGKIKDFIKNNPFYESCHDLKTSAESVISYSWDYSISGDKSRMHKTTMHAHGLMTFKRGIHCDGVYVDDPFQDPDNKLLLTKIYKINDIVKTQILDMPMDGGFCKIVGTPQTNDDFFFNNDLKAKFALRVQPAEVDTKKKIALWPQHMNWEELQARKQIRGKKVFNQEYNCMPTYSEESFFTEEDILKVTNEKLLNRSINDIIKSPERIERVGGWDLGKKRHPAHFVAFEIRYIKELNKYKAIQIHQKFMDGWNYTGKDDKNGNIQDYDPDDPNQISYVNQAIKNFQLDYVYCDNTRGELTTMEEQGKLPSGLELVIFTSKEKYAIATEFEKGVSSEGVELLNDERMRRQIICVTNDLQAIASPDGHGDAFWSIALSFKGINLRQESLGDYMDDDDYNESAIYEKSF